MNVKIIIFLLQCSVFLVASEDLPETKDLDVDDYDDELGRKHRKKKKKHQNNPCYGGYGRTFGEKFGPHDYTYVNAPVTNYFFGCGGGPPVAPVQAYPVQHGGNTHGHGHGHGHGGHGHGGGYGHGGYGNQGYQGAFGGPVNYGYNQPYQYNQYQNYNRPLQNVVSAAASGFGTAVAGYFNRPRKVNKQVNQFLRPLYKLF